MKKTIIAIALMSLYTMDTLAQQCSVSISNKVTTMSNGVVTVKIGSNGRVSSLGYKTYSNLLASSGIYFDYTASANQSLKPSTATIVTKSDSLVEVVYTNTTDDLRFSQGFIMRRGVNGLYTYVTVAGTAKPVKLREARVCTRLNSSWFTYGYVNNQMQGTLPSVATMKAIDTSGKVQDATFRLPNGSIYTKYNWANYAINDSLHGLMAPAYKIGVWNIPVSHEWLNGGPMKQELTVHTDTKSPLTIQMLQGEHFGASAQTYNEGEKKLYGPFLIYINRGNTLDDMVADAMRMAADQRAQWPFKWFSNSLYPTDRATVDGTLNLTTGQLPDSLMVVLAEPGGDIYTQGKKYIYHTLCRHDGSFTLHNVRKGTYALYAFATKGEITDQFEQDNIAVDDDDTHLGSLDWTPRKYEYKLWQIGQSDRMTDGFALSDSARAYGRFNVPPASLVFTIGQSNEKTDWYYAQTKNGTWNVNFRLDNTYTGKAHLTVAAAGATNNPKLSIGINGRHVGNVDYSNDAAIYRSAMLSGHYRLATFDFSTALLHKGTNTLTLTMSGIGSNGGIMYDCIKLEAGQTVTTGISIPTAAAGAVPVAYYTLGGVRISKPRSGVCIVRMSDGTTHKLIVKP